MSKPVVQLLNGSWSNKKSLRFACPECGGESVWMALRQSLNTGEFRRGAIDEWTGKKMYAHCGDCYEDIQPIITEVPT